MFSKLLRFIKVLPDRCSRPIASAQRRTRLSIDALEDRALPSASWGANGPPLLVNTGRVPARAVALPNGDATGRASIARSEVDYYRFVARSAGFYRFNVSSSFDAMVGVYSAGPAGTLLGYSDNVYAGTERLTVYLDAGKVYYLGVSNFRNRGGGNYRWVVNDVDQPAGAAAVPDSKRVLYLSFDGADLSAASLRAWDNDWQYGTAAELDPRGNGVRVTPFLASRPDREAIITSILGHVQADLSVFGVSVVRLAGGSSAVAGVGATTIFLGPSSLEDRGVSDPKRDLFHVAGDIDVGNNNATDIAFIANEDWGSASATALAVADVVLHEAGHTYGLFHVASGNHMESMGLRYSVANDDAWPQDTGFVNRSFHYLEYAGSQDSFQVVAGAFSLPLLSPATTGTGAGVRAAKHWRAEERALYHPHGMANDTHAADTPAKRGRRGGIRSQLPPS